MISRSFGSSGRSLPVVGQGTWQMENDPRSAIAALRRGLDLGMTHIDLPWCENRGIAVVAYSPLGQGRLPSGGALSEIATSREATEAQAALAYLHRRSFVIPKASNVAHVEENAGAADLVLTKEETRRLEAAFPVGPPRPLPTL